MVIQKFKPGKAQIRVGEHGRHITNQYTKELSHKHTKTRGSQNKIKVLEGKKKIYYGWNLGKKE